MKVGKKQQKQLYADTLQNRRSQKLNKVQRNVPVLDSLFDVAQALYYAILLRKKDSGTGVFFVATLRTFKFTGCVCWCLEVSNDP